MQKGNFIRAMLAAAAVVAGGAISAEAAETYTLNPVVVTATRTEKADLDVPATTTVITAEKIENAGYKNVFDAIQSQVGLTSTGYGDAGQDFGFSSGRTVIRGYDRGTLVLVDGIPINLKNYNSLDGIPIGMVEKIEIIKGSAGTLYGAEAMGGVVNIITKKPEAGESHVTLKGTVGNYYKDYGVTYSGENMIVSVSKEYSDDQSHSNAYPKGSDTDWWVGKGQKNRAAIAAKLTDEIGLNLMYQEGDITRGGIKYKGGKVSKQYDYRYDDKRFVGGLTYTGKENGIKAVLGYNYRQTKGWNYISKSKVDSSADLSSYIGDIQKQWDLGKDTLIVGYTFKREDYENLVKRDNKAHRNSHAIYASYTDVFSPKFSVTLGVRGEKIDDPVEDQDVFNPSIQTLYKINDTTSWYIDIGRGFQMPTVDSYYGKKAAKNTLKPEKGWTYETGIKKLFGDDNSLKFAVYHMDFENKIGWKQDSVTMEYEAYNKGDFRNTGVELEYEARVNDHWSYSLGLGYGNPEVKDPSAKKPVWTRDAARLDGVATVTYRAEKVRSTLSYKYLGERESYSTFGQVPNLSRLTWNTIYQVTKNDTIALTLNNLFDRDNYCNRYGNLDLPLNWRLSYSHTF